jgi:glycosyltransferase involved in cell wall biosynthesis
MIDKVVSIIIPVFNRDKLIKDTLSSIKNQTYENWECILVDDGSTDSTLEVINDYCKNDNRFIILKRPKDRLKGANSCRNYGFELSKGKYINWFDSDDLMHPDFIRNKVRCFTNKIDCVISKTCFFKNDVNLILGKETRTKLTDNLLEDFITLRTSWYLPDPMWEKKYLLDKNLFSEVLKKGQDRDFHIRMLINNPKLKVVEEYLTYYRQHDKTISNNYSRDVIQSYFDALNKRIKLLLKLKPSNDLKFFLLKEQIKNYPFLFKEEKSFYNFMDTFIKLHHSSFGYIVLFIKFIFSVISFKMFGKGSVFLKG